MQVSTFHIPQMDCPSEEQLIRMKLQDMPQVHALVFDLARRRLQVYHDEGPDPVVQRLEALNLGAQLQGSVAAGELPEPATAAAAHQERKLLWQVLAINFFFFALEAVTGFVSRSMGLLADSLDMLADSLVYGLALFAVGAPALRKKQIAGVSGYFQLALAVLGLAETIRRFWGYDTIPHFQTMIAISFLALLGNTLSLYLLQKSKSREVHMQASMIFTSNDVVANLGVILAGALVFWTQSKTPDLVIGIVVFAIVARGAFKILQLAKPM